MERLNVTINYILVSCKRRKERKAKKCPRVGRITDTHTHRGENRFGFKLGSIVGDRGRKVKGGDMSRRRKYRYTLFFMNPLKVKAGSTTQNAHWFLFKRKKFHRTGDVYLTTHIYSLENKKKKEHRKWNIAKGSLRLLRCIDGSLSEAHKEKRENDRHEKEIHRLCRQREATKGQEGVRSLHPKTRQKKKGPRAGSLADTLSPGRKPFGFWPKFILSRVEEFRKRKCPRVGRFSDTRTHRGEKPCGF